MGRQILIRLLASILIILAVISVPAPVPANGPPPPPFLNVSLRRVPAGAAFADILIKIDESDPNFTYVNEGNLELLGLSVDAEIVGFNADGFMSFTFHYNDAFSDIRIRREQHHNLQVRFAAREGRADFNSAQFQDLRNNYRDMKIVFLDNEGNIVHISREFTLPAPRTHLIGLTYEYRAEEEVRIDIRSSAIGEIILIWAIVVLSIALEFGLGLVFGFRGKQLLIILLANVTTQVLMWVIYFNFMMQLPHITAVIILEAAIYPAEFLIYRKSPHMEKESTLKLLIYTILANTLSLAVGIAVFW